MIGVIWLCWHRTKIYKHKKEPYNILTNLNSLVDTRRSIIGITHREEVCWREHTGFIIISLVKCKAVAGENMPIVKDTIECYCKLNTRRYFTAAFLAETRATTGVNFTPHWKTAVSERKYVFRMLT